MAHPHIFVETALRLEADAEGRVIAVEVEWRYDELYSLLLLEDMALDPDHDGVLTEEALARLDGFDMNWVEGFAGDLVVMAEDGAGIALSGPQPRGTEMREGRVVTRHRRELLAPGARVVLMAYDPGYYTAYDLVGGVVGPEGCDVRVQPADLDRASEILQAALKEMPPDPDDYPEVGDVFADRVEVRCVAEQ